MWKRISHFASEWQFTKGGVGGSGGGERGGGAVVPGMWVLVQQTDRPGNGAHQMRQRHPEPDDG